MLTYLGFQKVPRSLMCTRCVLYLFLLICCARMSVTGVSGYVRATLGTCAHIHKPVGPQSTVSISLLGGHTHMCTASLNCWASFFCVNLKTDVTFSSCTLVHWMCAGDNSVWWRLGMEKRGLCATYQCLHATTQVSREQKQSVLALR
jgi:hypothetical protein